MKQYSITIHKINPLPLGKNAPRHRFVQAFWADDRPYPTDDYCPSYAEQATARYIESLLQDAGTYLVVIIQRGDTSAIPNTWSWTVTVTPAPTPPPPPPTITWKM